MSKLFEDDSDNESNKFSLETNNEYAKNYEQWRSKEELNKLKTKYQEDLHSETSQSESDEDEEGIELTDKIERDFFKTLSCLKNKDPRIYDEKITFFGEADEKDSKRTKKTKQKGTYLKDYERKLILEKGGILSDEEDMHNFKQKESLSYVEEQNEVKENLKNTLSSLNDENDDDWGGIFTKRMKTSEERDNEEAEYKLWLAGQKNDITDEQIQTELKALKDFWNNPDLDKNEMFLKDYILNKRFLDKKNDYIPTYDEIIYDSDELSDDEEILEKQEEFEHKYNFRFEEPDQEFIKRYPRTMEKSLRRKDDKRKQKREEIKERKKKEKEIKMQELKKLRDLKQKEIEDKLEKLKEITGNKDLGFNDEDMSGEFDPEKHDKRMQELFNEEFYKIPEGDKKPEFPKLDEELEIENWNKFSTEHNNYNEGNGSHCEDENFIMDCDYDPTQTTHENCTPKKRGKRKSKFAEAVSKPKPMFDPHDKTYEAYFDEYYKLDCEDIIGDIPCRFKYRKVVPNDFGLSVEEIIMAKEKELNKWCSLKKAIQIRPDHVEQYDRIAYAKKGQNMALKRKILPSLFTLDQTSNEMELNNDNHSIEHYQKIGENENEMLISVSNRSEELNYVENGMEQSVRSKENKKHLKKKQDMDFGTFHTNSEKLKPSKVKKQKDKHFKNIQDTQQNDIKNVMSQKNYIKEYGQAPDTDILNVKPLTHEIEPPVASDVTKKKLGAHLEISNAETNNEYSGKYKEKQSTMKEKESNKVAKEIPGTNLKQSKNKRKRRNQSVDGAKYSKKQKPVQPLSKITDERLSAYGIKPKKFRNKLKYKN